MRQISKDQLKVRYSTRPPEGQPNDVRLAEHLELGISEVFKLGDAIQADLDPKVMGIGWWTSYTGLGQKERIYISDHLVGAARAVSGNVLEGVAERLELGSAIEDFRYYLSRGIKNGEVVAPPPRGPADDISPLRTTAAICGVLRALASALDCLGTCVVGVAGLSTSIVRADLATTRKHLDKAATRNPRLSQLAADLTAAIAAAGPSGWMTWLIAMRNTDVHRARRIMNFNVVRGAGNAIEGINLNLPKSPELTEIQAYVYAGGVAASHFEAPAEEFLDHLMDSTHAFLNAAARLLEELWRERQLDHTLVEQPASQWVDSPALVSSTPAFGGYPDIAASDTALRAIATSDEMRERLEAAGMTLRATGDLKPAPQVWH
ncbi:hypothetical protein [Catenulispora pinisilvae]|uniref:hypothetical protein n=1 Tax=Catenulispora pinisilvae TaxID=2705253 RepID=UPI0018921D08|nr:hypothetical protein [Catenulispora pinisilvae]